MRARRRWRAHAVSRLDDSQVDDIGLLPAFPTEQAEHAAEEQSAAAAAAADGDDGSSAEGSTVAAVDDGTADDGDAAHVELGESDLCPRCVANARARHLPVVSRGVVAAGRRIR